MTDHRDAVKVAIVLMLSGMWLAMFELPTWAISPFVICWTIATVLIVERFER